jgi:hypothetical protein
MDYNDITQIDDYSSLFDTITGKYMENIYEKGFRLTVSAEYKVGLFFKTVTLYLEPNMMRAINPKDKNEYHPHVILDFDQVTADMTIHRESQQFRIQVLGYRSSFVFRTKKEVFDTTIMHVYQYIKASRGRRVNLCGVSLRRDFYKVSLV